MPYRIRKGEGLGEAFQRILAEETARAAEESACAAHSRDQAIHQLRKRCKRVRGLLSLYREILGLAATGTDRKIRDYSRSLAGTRSEAALAEIAHRFRLTTFQSATPDETELPPTDVALIVPLLTQVASFCGPLAMKTVRNDLLRGIRKISNRSKKAWTIATHSPTTAHLHRWRTQVKTHWYATRLTQDLDFGKTGSSRKQLARLGEGLGIHHDLSIILDRFAGEGRSADDPDRRRARKLRKQIARRMLQLGSRVYSK
ncbi:MAG: CHAD domain-containing protein [Opitutaceae bacterium]